MGPPAWRARRTGSRAARPRRPRGSAPWFASTGPLRKDRLDPTPPLPPGRHRPDGLPRRNGPREKELTAAGDGRRRPPSGKGLEEDPRVDPRVVELGRPVEVRPRAPAGAALVGDELALGDVLADVDRDVR